MSTTPEGHRYKDMDVLFLWMWRHGMKHPGARFERADREEENLVGFCDPEQGVSWFIHVDDLKLARSKGDRRVNLVWRTPQRRDLLAEKLSQGVIPRRFPVDTPPQET